MKTANEMNKMLNAALNYAALGIPIFPCKPDKKPYTAHGFKDATTKTEQIKEWWTKYPNAMIGIPTGKASGLLVLDIDVKNGVNGIETLAGLEAQYGKLPATPIVATPSGGIHHYFAMPETNPPLGNSNGKLGPGVDTRGDGGYIIASPSVNSSGKSYELVNEDIELAEVPLWLIDLLMRSRNDFKQIFENNINSIDDTLYGTAALEGIVAEMAATPEGQRNDMLFKLSCRLGSLVAGGELSEASAEQIKDAAAKAGLDNNEIEKTFNSGFNTGMQEPYSAATVAKIARIAVTNDENVWLEPQPIASQVEARAYHQ